MLLECCPASSNSQVWHYGLMATRAWFRLSGHQEWQDFIRFHGRRMMMRYLRCWHGIATLISQRLSFVTTHKSLRVLNEAFSSSINRKILQENLSTHLSAYDVRVLLFCLARWRLRLEGLPVNSEMHLSCCYRCNSFLSKMKIKAECAAASEVFKIWDLPGRSCNGVSRTSCMVLDGFQRLCLAVWQSSCARTTWDPLPVTSHDISEMQTPNCIPSNVPENISVLWRLACIMFLFGHEFAVN